MPRSRAGGGSNASVSTVFGTTTKRALGATSRSWRARSWLTGATTSARWNACRASTSSEPVIRPRPKAVKCSVTATAAPASRPMASAGSAAEYTCACTTSGRQPSRRSRRTAATMPTSWHTSASGRSRGRR